MLMMRTCHASTTYKVDMKSDWVESFFIVPPTHKPGTVFHYDTSAAHVLCALVEKLTHMPMLDYMKEKTETSPLQSDGVSQQVLDELRALSKDIVEEPTARGFRVKFIL